jgi:aldehyde dehydrogenase (NAD+)
MHLSNDHLPFGGVGNSGIGNYHGKFGFEAFSHQKAVLQRATWGEPDIKYPPILRKKLIWIKNYYNLSDMILLKNNNIFMT